VVAGTSSLLLLQRIARPLIKEIPASIKQVSNTSQLDELAQYIRYYDEVLTQSARNYAFTQDEKWKQRYEEVEPNLDRIIKRAISRGDKEDKAFFSSVDQANLALVELEYRSIELVKNGQIQEAVEILESDEYWRYKDNYKEGLMKYVHRRDHQQDRAIETSSEIIQSLTDQSRRLINVGRLAVLIAAATALTLLVSMSLYIFRDARRLTRLKESAAEIGRGNLDTQVVVDSNDEIGFLGQMLNSMASNFKEVTSSRNVLNQEIATREQAERKLKETHAELERRIFEQGQAQDASLNMMEDIELENAERKKAEDDLKEAQAELIESAHAAGRAEVAANVLHNVGNILNSINVSANLITEKIVHSEIGNLGKVAGIVNDNVEDLGTFLTQHPQGKHIPEYLSEVAKCLQNEQTEIVDRLQMLNDNVRHIKDIISVQQAYARIAGVEVRASLAKLVEDAIQINVTGLERHGIRLVREFEELVDVEIDKQRVIQILVNLINNAKDSLGLSKKADKSMTIRIYRRDEDRCCIEVADNGIGISEENLAKIFTHGFTTKTHGHGFGLHSCALASREMGGSLTAHSDGVGQGARFTLELPFKPSEDME
jgi:signal transduction histidine kinase